MHPAVTLALFTLRHGVATMATVVAAAIAWTITYALLLLWAIAANGGLGGPLAYPGGLVFVIAAALVACATLFFPATALAEWMCRRRGWPIAAQIPVSVAALAVLCLVAGVVVRLFRETTPALRFSAWLFALSLIPIGFYWWVVQAGPLIRKALELIPRLRTRLQRMA